MDDLKKCAYCGIYKPLEKFHNDIRGRNQKKNYCIECSLLYNKKRYIEQKNSIILKNQLYQEKNKEEYKKYQKQYREKRRNKTHS